MLIVQNIPLHALAVILTICHPKDLAGNAKILLCGQFTVHCDCGRLTYQDPKSKYNCICGNEFEYDNETGIATY